ncbi:MAG: secreted protein [Frankiales bacterium]|nr:secreted protein [Frankiales bacterium]
MSTPTSPDSQRRVVVPPDVPRPADGPPRPTGKKKRGSENVRDMLLSMGICTAIVIPIWYLAQPPASDSKTIRVVDPTSDITAFSAAAPGVPVPRVVPKGWRATSSTLTGATLRIGWVTPDDGYVEYAAQGGAPGAFVADQTGRAQPVSPLTVAGRAFRVYSASRAHTSLVLQQAAGTVVVGGVRETGDDAHLTELAQGLR